MHVEPSRRFRHVAVALLEHPLDMLPAHAVGGHRMFGRLGQRALARVQRRVDRVGVGGFGEIVDRPRLDRRDRGRDVPVAGQDDDPRVRRGFADARHEIEPRTVAELEIHDRAIGREAAGQNGSCRYRRLRHRHRIAAPLHRARQAHAERFVVFDDQQFARTRVGCGRRRHRRVGLSVHFRSPLEDPRHPKAAFGHRTDTRAPPSRRFSQDTAPPVRESKVFAMKIPNPICSPSPMRVDT